MAKASKTNPLPFRVSFADGIKMEITAEGPQAASAIAVRRRTAAGESNLLVLKVKLIRETKLG